MGEENRANISLRIEKNDFRTILELLQLFDQ